MCKESKLQIVEESVVKLFFFLVCHTMTKYLCIEESNIILI